MNILKIYVNEMHSINIYLTLNRESFFSKSIWHRKKNLLTLSCQIFAGDEIN